jgi:hypothetical protein
LGVQFCDSRRTTKHDIPTSGESIPSKNNRKLTKSIIIDLYLDISIFRNLPKSKLDSTTTCFFPLAAAKSAKFLANSTIIPCLNDHSNTSEFSFQDCELVVLTGHRRTKSTAKENYQARRINLFSNFPYLLHSLQTIYRKANILRGMRNVKQDSDMQTYNEIQCFSPKSRGCR